MTPATERAVALYRRWFNLAEITADELHDEEVAEANVAQATEAVNQARHALAAVVAAAAKAEADEQRATDDLYAAIEDLTPAEIVDYEAATIAHDAAVEADRRQGEDA